MMPGVIPLHLMRIELTDDFTFISKWVAAPTFGGIAVLMLAQMLIRYQELRAGDYWFAAVWLPCAALAFRYGLRLKNVSMDEKFLYVSNYVGEVAIPLSNLIGVKEKTFPLWFSVNFVYLSEASGFGRVIMFQPRLTTLLNPKQSEAYATLRKVVRQNQRAKV
jgi:hypothetical protein